MVNDDERLRALRWSSSVKTLSLLDRALLPSQRSPADDAPPPSPER